MSQVRKDCFYYEGDFIRNILVLRKTGCRKINFDQKLGINNFIGDLQKVIVGLTKQIFTEREAEIRSCFSFKTECHYDELDKHIDDFKWLLSSFLGTEKSGQQSDSAEQKSDNQDFDKDGFLVKNKTGVNLLLWMRFKVMLMNHLPLKVYQKLLKSLNTFICIIFILYIKKIYLRD